MAQMAGRDGAGLDRAVRVAFWSAAVLLLVAPLVVVRVNDGMRWDSGDFTFVALLLGALGIGFEVTMRTTRSWPYRFGVGFAVATTFLIVLANGAVGMIGDEENPYNLCFLGAIAVAVAGAVLARFRAGGMALAMGAAAIVHAGVALGGYSADPRGSILSLGMALVWLVSAALFRMAGRG